MYDHVGAKLVSGEERWSVDVAKVKIPAAIHRFIKSNITVSLVAAGINLSTFRDAELPHVSVVIGSIEHRNFVVDFEPIDGFLVKIDPGRHPGNVGKKHLGRIPG